LQCRVFRFGLFQDGDVGIGVLPEGEEISAGGEGAGAGRIGIRSLRGSRLPGIGASHAQMRQRSSPAIPDDAAVVDNLLKLGGGSIALAGFQVCFTPDVCGIKAGKIQDELDLP